jgi:hypothetical protein
MVHEGNINQYSTMFHRRHEIIIIIIARKTKYVVI